MSDSNAFLVKIKDWFKPIEGAITRPIIGSRNMDIEIDGAWQTDVIDQSESSSSFTVNDLALEFTFAGVTLPDVVDPIDHFTPRVITKIRVKINLYQITATIPASIFARTWAIKIPLMPNKEANK